MAATLKRPRSPRAGDRLVIRAHRQGQAERDGEILEVLGTARPRFRVRWEDGRESIVYPRDDAFIDRLPHSR